MAHNVTCSLIVDEGERVRVRGLGVGVRVRVRIGDESYFWTNHLCPRAK